MKKLVRFMGLILLLALFASLLPSASVSADPDKLIKPDKEKPVLATDVELVKKVSIDKELRGGAPGSKKVTSAATGTLGAPVSGSRYAVIVGISDYPGTTNDLNYCDDDALEMNNVLTDWYGYTNVDLLVDDMATRKNVLTAIEDIPSKAGEVVFFFSGHGTKGIAEDGDNEKIDEAIVVVSNDGSRLVSIWDGELKGAFSGFSAATRIILIFDSCLSGGMKNDLQGLGRVINMACTETGYSYELDSLQHGEFTYYFVEQGMELGKANVHDYDTDGKFREPGQVTVEEALDYARANCTLGKPNIGDYFADDLLL